MLHCQVDQDPLSVELAQEFDLIWDGTSTFAPLKMPLVPRVYGIGLICGPSGSGKSLLLHYFGDRQWTQWDPRKSIAAHFKSAQEAQEKFAAVGLNSVPTWLKPFHVLSTGEMFRARLARQLRSGAVIDEYTSVVDRNVALSTSIALRRYIDQKKLTHITIATCHLDVIRWLQPDWVFRTDVGSLQPGGRLPRPKIHIEITRCSVSLWRFFSPHHYLTAKIHKQSQCYAAFWDGRLVGFTSVLAFPHPRFKNAFREHRTVILPDFQGCGIGVRLSDAIAKSYVDRGCRYYSRTSHPRMGEWRQRSPLWKPTATNLKKQTKINTTTQIQNHWTTDTRRLCYSHRYIGPR